MYQNTHRRLSVPIEYTAQAMRGQNENSTVCVQPDAHHSAAELWNLKGQVPLECPDSAHRNVKGVRWAFCAKLR